MHKRGYTLVEVILALAILGILAAGLLPVFVSAFMQIVTAGERSETLHEAQNIAENAIYQGVEGNSDQITFTFSNNGSDPFQIELWGEFVENGTVELFIPKE